MTNGSGVSRGDRNRNARLSRLRSAVPVSNAIVGIDLADRKQMVVVCDHDSRVLARKTFRCKAWDLGAALDWAADRATRAGFAGVTVACEPTGHRWRVLGELAGSPDPVCPCGDLAVLLAQHPTDRLDRKPVRPHLVDEAHHQRLRGSRMLLCCQADSARVVAGRAMTCWSVRSAVNTVSERRRRRRRRAAVVSLPRSVCLAM